MNVPSIHRFALTRKAEVDRAACRIQQLGAEGGSWREEAVPSRGPLTEAAETEKQLFEDRLQMKIKTTKDKFHSTANG